MVLAILAPVRYMISLLSTVLGVVFAPLINWHNGQVGACVSAFPLDEDGTEATHSRKRMDCTTEVLKDELILCIMALMFAAYFFISAMEMNDRHEARMRREMTPRDRLKNGIPRMTWREYYDGQLEMFAFCVKWTWQTLTWPFTANQRKIERLQRKIEEIDSYYKRLEETIVAINPEHEAVKELRASPSVKSTTTMISTPSADMDVLGAVKEEMNKLKQLYA